MKMRFLGLTIILASLAVLQGCATSASIQGMTYQRAQASQALTGQLSVTSVSGGKQTNPLWTSQVSSEGFEAALRDSLKAAGMLGAPGSAPLNLKANLVSLKQPMVGFDMTVTASVHYVVSDAGSKVVLDETISTPHTATVGDAFVGTKRLQLANEGAIRKNIEALIGKLEKLNLQQVSMP